MAKLVGFSFRTKLEETKAARPAMRADAKKPKRGKHLISGLFEEPAYQQFTMLAHVYGRIKPAASRPLDQGTE